MDVVLNDYAIDSQFSSIDNFVDSLAEYTLPALDFLKNKSGILLKSYETYGRKITDDETINKKPYAAHIGLHPLCRLSQALAGGRYSPADHYRIYGWNGSGIQRLLQY